MTRETQERRIETQIEIAAPVEDVWRALTDAEWLTNWFPLEARVRPGVGGSIWTSWGGGAAFESPIAAWEENKHLRLLYMPATPPEKIDEATAQGMYIPFEVAVDYFLDSNGGSTVLRLVHSGFSDDAAWDTQYDGTVTGWALELRGLRHFLEKHRGVKRDVVWARHDITGLSLPDAWSRLFTDDGLRPRNAVETLEAGDRYSFTTPRGDSFEGAVQIVQPPRHFCGTAENLDNALLRIKLDEQCFTAPKPEIHLMLSTFGLPRAETDGLRDRAQSMLNDLYNAMVESK